MKPPPFDYAVPTSIAEAISLLQEHGEGAKILAGGQSLVPLLNFRLIEPQILVDINRIEGLSYIEERDGGLRIGTLTRHRTLETSALVRSKCPILSKAASLIGHVAIRNRGTFGGSLAHADPAAELPLLLATLGGRIFVSGVQGDRGVDAADFFIDYLTTDLRPTELLVGAWIPNLPSHTGWGFHEFTLQHGGFAVAAAAALVTLDHQGACRSATITIGNVAPTPLRAKKAELLLQGVRPGNQAIAEAARLAVEGAQPTSDFHTSAEYRKALAEVLVRRTLEDAWARARQQNE